jgi:GNAT superfamily N-acetyltransferase
MIRNAEPRDYPIIAAIHNDCWPAHPTTAEQMERLDATLGRERFVIEDDGLVIAHARLEATRSETAFLDLDVRPDRQKHGFGSRLYAFLEPRFEPLSSVMCFAREDHPFSSAFAERRGFQEVMRSWHQSLEVAQFDPAPFRDLESKLEREGYAIQSFADITDPDRERKLHALYAQALLDVPGATDIPDFERFRARTLEDPLFLPEAYFVAIREGEWVAYTGTRQRTPDTPLEWHTNMTGVLREHRGRGLAVALKVRAIELARERGVSILHTNNASSNAGMLAVNTKLGYVKDAAQIQFEKRCKKDTVPHANLISRENAC